MPSRPARRPSGAGGPRVSVRIATDRQKSPQAPSGAAVGRSTQPMAPQYRPRGVLSSPAISSIVWCLGAPVIEPQGNTARSTVGRSVPGASSALTVEVIWNTVACDSTSNSSGTFTEPVRAMRPRSLRSRSTIIRFSARFLVSRLSSRAVSLSPSSTARRGAVPFIGLATSRPCAWRTNSSGEHDSTCATPLAATSSAGSAMKAP
ncbi:hypothetical protein X551_04742 [Methylibium sp. T29]|nr:hypothetical protein X551_04742 [Methylibium sp. T29]